MQWIPWLNRMDALIIGLSLASIPDLADVTPTIKSSLPTPDFLPKSHWTSLLSARMTISSSPCNLSYMLRRRLPLLLAAARPTRTSVITATLPNTFYFSTKNLVMRQEFKLKDITSLSLSPGSKQEVEVEGVEGGKVLLVNARGQIQAIGAKCTHYGAPLSKGVLTSDGRIKCPWHGGTRLVPVLYPDLVALMLIFRLFSDFSMFQHKQWRCRGSTGPRCLACLQGYRT